MPNLMSNAFAGVQIESNRCQADLLANHYPNKTHPIALVYLMVSLLPLKMKKGVHEWYNRFVDAFVGHGHLHCFVDDLL